MIAISAFYGIWTGLDHMFEKTDVTLDGKALNATYCVILGFSCGVLVFVSQFLFVWLYYKPKTTEKLQLKSINSQKLFRLLGYDLVLLVVLIGNVASFRGIWNILDCYFIPGINQNFGAKIQIYVLNTLARIFIFLSYFLLYVNF